MTTQITEKTVTLNLKTAWGIMGALILYTFAISSTYFNLANRVSAIETTLKQHESSITEFAELKADMREIKVRMEDFPELRQNLKEIDAKLDEVMKQQR